MLQLATGEVKAIQKREEKILHISVETKDGEVSAVNYLDFVPDLEVGDFVVLNTTAVDLGLGTGGVHFVLGTLFKPRFLKREEGHLMKLRYTPLQFSTQCLEETVEGRAKLDRAFSVEGSLCLVAELASQIPSAAFTLRKLRPTATIAYIMTESASLALPFVQIIQEAKKRNWINTTITYGQAFGGDIETVNIYSALLAARHWASADFILISQGAGGVGTESHWGFSALDLLAVLQAIHFLKGKAIFIPRLSFQETRERHRGISHHTQTLLNLFPTPLFIPFPNLGEDEEQLLLQQMASQPWTNCHFVEKKETAPLFASFLEHDWGIRTMGRSVAQEPVFFQAPIAAALLAHELHEKR